MTLSKAPLTDPKHAATARISRHGREGISYPYVELRFTAQEIRSAAEAFADAARHLGDPRAALFGPAPGSLGPGESG